MEGPALIAAIVVCRTFLFRHGRCSDMNLPPVAGAKLAIRWVLRRWRFRRRLDRRGRQRFFFGTALAILSTPSRPSVVRMFPMRGRAALLAGKERRHFVVS